jgi:hypothetical protein
MIKLKHFFIAVPLFALTGSGLPGDEGVGDLMLGDWGSYSDRYAGISHIADPERGLRFDLSVFPLTPGKKNLPMESAGSGNVYSYWAAKPDLDAYTLRFVMDQVRRRAWCDVSYFRQDDASRLFCVDLNNTSRTVWDGEIHLLAHLRYPPWNFAGSYKQEPLRPALVDLPDGALWIRGLGYDALNLASPDVHDVLPERGVLRREVRIHGSVGGSALGRGFGQAKGDQAVYRFKITQGMGNAVLLLRGRSDGDSKSTFRLEGLVKKGCSFPVSDEFGLLTIDLGRVRAGSHEIIMTSEGTGSVLLDGFAVVDKNVAGKVRFSILEPNSLPEITTVGNRRGVILSYPDLKQVYGYALAIPEGGELRTLMWRNLYRAFGESDHGSTKIHGGGRHGKGDPEARFVDLGFDQEPLPDRGKRRYWGMVCTGSKDEVHRRLLDFLARPPDELEKKSVTFEVLPPYNLDGEHYALSQQLMTAATSMNIIYPHLHELRYIPGYTPAKNWGCMFTWDNGMHGIGLNLLDAKRSAELMCQVTTAPGAETPYIWGGSPMPIQFYQFREWWNLYQHRATMEKLYPRLKQMYEWFIGRGHGSNTRGPAKDRMISTYEYFYNLGWDDYPGHSLSGVSNRKLGWTTPVCQSVHTLIGARALGQAASVLGLDKDAAVFEADARQLEEAILEDAWDGESGYFGYVVYDWETGDRLGILRGKRKRPSTIPPHREQENLEVFVDGKSGVNINMGLDGVEPWFAGLGSPEQREQQFRLLSTEGMLWTPNGLITVDPRSPFSGEGYWNNRAWIPPQWWFWKGALDQGKGEFAYRVAHAVLDNARRVSGKWTTYENYSTTEEEAGGTGMNFAGLSTPTLDFFYSYYVPGTLSFGHDAWVEEKKWSEDKTSVRAVVRFGQDRPGETRLAIACFSPGGEITATWKGQPVPVEKITDGAVYVSIPCHKERGELIIKKE